jgi:CHAD domain-containing protein
MREYALARTVDLLKQLAKQIKQFGEAPRDQDADAIHDVRVAIRRLRECLRIFSKFYPGKSWKKVRRSLAEAMQYCGEVRDRDIALGLLAGAGVPDDSNLVQRLRKERRAADRDLRRRVTRWKKSGLGRELKADLEV